MKRKNLIRLYRTDFLAFAPLLLRAAGVPAAAASSWHVEVLADAAMVCAPGAGRWSMVNAPPRHLKSLICAVAWPLFAAANYPAARIVVVAGTRELSADLAAKRLALSASSRFRSVFEGLTWREDGDTVRFSNGSTIVSAAVSRSQVGRGADLMVIDDPQTPSQFNQAGQERQGLLWFSTEVAPRLNGAAASLLLVMQRLHKDDLCGSLYSKGRPWQSVCLPAIAGETCKYPLSRGAFVTHQKGDVLCEAVAGKDALEAKLSDVGGRTFWAHYLQHPLSALGDSDSYIYFEDRDVYDGWKPSEKLLPTGFYRRPYDLDILEGHFRLSASPSYSGRRKMTDEEWEAAALIQQRRLVERHTPYGAAGAASTEAASA